MFPGRHHLAGLLAAGLPGLLVFAFAHSALNPAPPKPPRLAVLIVFDQLRGDYLQRWHTLFEDGGFHRLEAEGAWFQNCHYPYALTMTGPGHASVATGCSPNKHGIIANDWYDRRAGKSVNCVGSDRYDIIPPLSGKKKGVSPERLLSPALADALKQATRGKARVVSLSLKDRSAVLPGGKRPDACYWLDKDGNFVTSLFYRDRLHPWVRVANQCRLSERWYGTTWTRLRSGMDYERWSGPDDAPGEAYAGVRRTFPHPLAGKASLPDRSYQAALAMSPYGNDLLLDMARRAIDAEGLGTRDTPDLLAISFSSNDLVGHCWGPDSQEVLDTTLRSDLVLRALLSHLDRRVGRGRYFVALTADHGICPLPEASRTRGLDAQRIDPRLMWREAGAHLSKTFAIQKARWFESTHDKGAYLNRAVLRQHRLEQARVEYELAGWLRRQPGVAAVYTRTALLLGEPGGDPIGRKVWRSFHAARSGDVLLVEKPLYLFTTYLAGTNHGTPHPYDTHVPLIVSGPGIRPGIRSEPVTPQAAAVILARSLGIAAPAHADAAVPANLFTAR
jgi:predicted AlkP superfamily pyrophosphatase or phosphodiesterase